MDVAKIVLAVVFILACIILIVFSSIININQNIKITLTIRTYTSSAIQYQNFRALALVFYPASVFNTSGYHYIDFILLNYKDIFHSMISSIICYFYVNGVKIENGDYKRVMNLTNYNTSVEELDVILPEGEFTKVNFSIIPCLVYSSSS